MKALFKMLIATVVAILMVGCGTMTGAAVGAHYGGPGGAAVGAGIGAIIDEHGVVHRGRTVAGGQQQGYAGGGLRAAPCEPFRAPALMAWATELGNSSQKRTADVSNSNGHVQCYSSESARSGTGTGRRDGSNARSTERYPAATVYEMR